MEKLTYKNGEQLINDAVRMLIKKHLAWGGSDKSMPSRDLDNVRGAFIEAWLEGWLYRRQMGLAERRRTYGTLRLLEQ